MNDTPDTNQALVPSSVAPPEWKNPKEARDSYECTGRWNNEAVFQILRVFDHRWFGIPELARIAFGSASPRNQEKARSRISRLWHHARKFHRRVIIKEYERLIVDAQRGQLKMRKNPLKGHNVIARVKLATVEDMALAESELNQRLHHNEITQKDLIVLHEALVEMARLEVERQERIKTQPAAK